MILRRPVPRSAPRGAFPRRRFTTRRAWRNHTGNQQVEPLRLLRPRTVEELTEIVREAEALGTHVRAVGSGHSWSDVALTRGFLIETHGLNRELPMDCLRGGVDPLTLARTQAGVRLRELNRRLEREGRALSNMGGWDAQTLAGVASTSTHGSALGMGPIADALRSLDVVASGGRLLRLEPAGGPTDPEAFEELWGPRGWELHQDDHWWDAVRVGMGCMGITYAATIAVEPLYDLTERRRTRRWRAVAGDLVDGKILEENRHYEVYVNPHRRGTKDNLCLETFRNKATGGRRRGADRRRNLVPEITGALTVTPKVIDLLVNLVPSASPALLDGALKMLRDPNYTDVSYRVLNLGAANLLPAYSMEIAVPIEGDRHVRAMDTVIEVSERRRKVGDVYSTSPVSLRFVKRSSAYMSMMEGRDTMMIELIQLSRTEGGFELLAEYEEMLYGLGGRPHWGQYNTLTGSNGLVASMYPHFNDWLDVHRRLNETGVFDSPFSKRVGISRSKYQG